MGQKVGVPCPFLGELDPHLTHCLLGRGLPLHQVASSSIQPFRHNRHGPKIQRAAVPLWGVGPHLIQCGKGRGLSPYQVPSWSMLPFGHNRHGPKIGVVPLLGRGAGSPSKTPGPRPTSMPSFNLIYPTVWPHNTPTLQTDSLGHPCKFQRVSRLGSDTDGTPVLGVSQTLRRWTEGATYIRQDGHHVWHWPTFYFCSVSCFCVKYSIVYLVIAHRASLAIEIVSEALCCITFGQSCMICIMQPRKMWRPWKKLENVTECYPYIYVE